MQIILRLSGAALLLLLPLIPSAFLYLVVKAPIQAHVTGPLLGLSMTLSGPAALYVILLIYLKRIYKDMLLPHQQMMQSRYSEIYTTCNALCGTWNIISEFRDEENTTRQFKGQATISFSDRSKLDIHGTWEDEQGVRLGTWSADDLMIDKRKMILLFAVPSPAGLETTGLMHLKLHYDGDKNLATLEGMWGVLGENVKGYACWRRTTA